MGMAPFPASAKVPNRTDTKLPQPLLSPAERLRRLEEAKAFLCRQLAGGPQPARMLLSNARAAGIAERTLHRAKDLLGVTTERAGGYAGYGQWVWYPEAVVNAVSRPTADIAARAKQPVPR
jgi:hypothetical protein